MNIKVHYLITLCALFSIGVLFKNPGLDRSTQEEERICKMVKGRMDCIYKYTDYKIKKDSEIQYNLN